MFIESVSQYSIWVFIGASISIAIEYIFIRFGKNFIFKKKYPDWYKGYKLAGFKTQEKILNEITDMINNTDAVIEENKKYKSANIFINIGFKEQPQVCTAIISAYKDIVDGVAVYTTKELSLQLLLRKGKNTFIRLNVYKKVCTECTPEFYSCKMKYILLYFV